MKREKELNHLKFLFDAYLPQYWWTEVMECVRKLFLTGFMVFIYEGSGLQIMIGLVISFIFAIIYAHLNPYLMPSNNTFATFVHFLISFTLLCTLMIKVNQFTNEDDENQVRISTSSLSTALTISCTSVIGVGAIMIFRGLFVRSEGDYVNLGYDINSSKAKEDDYEKERKRVDTLSGDAQFIGMMGLESRRSSIVFMNQFDPLSSQSQAVFKSPIVENDEVEMIAKMKEITKPIMI